MNIVGSNNVFSNYIKTLVNDKYNIRSGYAYYDSITHYYLGRYLRDYKKETGIDLTSMYNCYSENIISKYRLKTNSFTSYDKVKRISFEATLENIDASAYDLVYMQVLPKDILSLYFDTSLPITLTVASFNGIDFVDRRFDNVQVIPSSRIKEPFIYRVPDYDTDQKDNSYRVDNLVLLIQVPKSCTKRIVLLGDYSDTSTKVVSYDASSENTQIIPNINSFLKEGRCQSFLDELIPYLTHYAITELDEVFQNISSIQSFMSSHKLRKTYGMRYVGDTKEGTLDNAQREWLKQFKSKHIGNYNNIGRVDKDVEELLDRGGNLDA